MSLDEKQVALSRRRFLGGAAAVAFASALPGSMAPLLAETERSGYAYVGTYTGATGNLGNGEGIYLFRHDRESGALSDPQLVAQTPSPSLIAFHPSKRYLYVVNEIDNFQGKNGSVTAFAIDPSTRHLRSLNTVSSEGGGPAYLSVDAGGRFVFVANYGGGSIAVFPIEADGDLGPACDVHRDQGSIGGQHAADAPVGSFAISGHDGPHAHMILPDPGNRFVLATDLGQDRIYSYRFDALSGKLVPNEAAPFATLPSGDGPRHFAFHPNRRWLYSIQEESSTVVFFTYDGQTGVLKAQQTVSCLPPGFAGTSFASEILVSRDGKFVYAANRLHDAISVLSIGSDGKLTWRSECSTLGDYPSQMQFDPAGNFLYACNRKSDCITTFRVDRMDGSLRPTGRYTGIGSPGSIEFL